MSLSKVYGLIDRFSEDIDLVLNWELLGFSNSGNDPWQELSSQTHRTSRLPPGYSRHYYDMYQPSDNNIKVEAFADSELLSNVMQFKATILPVYLGEL